MSATLEAEKFQGYFTDAPLMVRNTYAPRHRYPAGYADIPIEGLGCDWSMDADGKCPASCTPALDT
eukprot:7930177-Pyramimonas_sp.AAC.1